MDYWKECISEAFEDAGISASEDQMGTVSSWVEGAHENYSMAFGYDDIPSQSSIEINQLKKELDMERKKVTCEGCSGTGDIVIYGGTYKSTSTCNECRGEGRRLP